MQQETKHRVYNKNRTQSLQQGPMHTVCIEYAQSMKQWIITECETLLITLCLLYGWSFQNKKAKEKNLF